MYKIYCPNLQLENAGELLLGSWPILVGSYSEVYLDKLIASCWVW